ncbi:XRE family transcriptional regulator [Bordetella sp. 15P40C-2]|uniref:helix-turn-helix domain-containing protein n=1 Tax=Bordetella sp. 15P40C-2 TaxID=2572246 RepID=UPI0013292B00|nr:helix-turn-helix domain-containing protein [Bordetella sp. 15P40C-2]
MKTPSRAKKRQSTTAPDQEYPTPGSADSSDQDLGRRLRAMRKAKGFTLQELAARTDMSIGMLSQVERGVSSPSMRSLRSLCAALGIDGATLFSNSDDSDGADSANEFAVWASQRKALRLADSGVTKYRVTPANCASLEAFLMELEPGAASDPNLLMQTGDKVGYIISGKLRVFIGDETLLLQAGDTYGFTGTRRYRWENAWDQPTVFLVVNSAHFYV